MVFGPLNGGLPWPKEYPELLKKECEWLAPIRNAYHKLPYHQSSYRKLAGVVAGTRHTATETPADFGGQKFYMPENGSDPARFNIAESWSEPNGQFRFFRWSTGVIQVTSISRYRRWFGRQLSRTVILYHWRRSRKVAP